jgi:hypothetical protein
LRCHVCSLLSVDKNVHVLDELRAASQRSARSLRMKRLYDERIFGVHAPESRKGTVISRFNFG